MYTCILRWILHNKLCVNPLISPVSVIRRGGGMERISCTASLSQGRRAQLLDVRGEGGIKKKQKHKKNNNMELSITDTTGNSVWLSVGDLQRQWGFVHAAGTASPNLIPWRRCVLFMTALIWSFVLVFAFTRGPWTRRRRADGLDCNSSAFPADHIAGALQALPLVDEHRKQPNGSMCKWLQ